MKTFVSDYTNHRSFWTDDITQMFHGCEHYHFIVQRSTGQEKNSVDEIGPIDSTTLRLEKCNLRT